jgi:threonine dehydrogenase-like Zn-dependent dehydrogenase
MNQCNVKRYMPHLLEHVRSGRVDPTEIITHRLPLEAVAEGYQMFSKHQDGCVKAVLIPPSAA